MVKIFKSLNFDPDPEHQLVKIKTLEDFLIIMKFLIEEVPSCPILEIWILTGLFFRNLELGLD